MQPKRHTDNKNIPCASVGHKKAMRTAKGLGAGITIHNVPDGVIMEENGVYFQLKTVGENG